MYIRETAYSQNQQVLSRTVGAGRTVFLLDVSSSGPWKMGKGVLGPALFSIVKEHARCPHFLTLPLGKDENAFREAKPSGFSD